MRKLILTTILLATHALAFSQTAQVSTDPVAATTPVASVTVESTAHSVGKWFGQLVQAPVAVAKSLVSGVQSGYSGDTAPVSAQPTAAPAEVPASASPLSALRSGLLDALAMVRIPRGPEQAPAPVEDRSAYVSDYRGQ